MPLQKLERICLVVASEMTVKAFLKPHIIALAQRYEVTLVLHTKQPDFSECNELPVTVIPLAIERAINPISDIRALYRLVQVFRQHHFGLVHSVTPKAGLLAMTAAKLAGINFRIHTFTGQVWATHRGFFRMLLKNMDRVLAASATHLLADSRSQREFLIAQGVTRVDKVSVLADGSISGVDVDRFKPDQSARDRIRQQLALGDDDVLLLFLGRLNRDKGVLDLARAAAGLMPSMPQLHLLFVGPDEGGLQSEIQQLMGQSADQLHFVDYTEHPEDYFAAADIFCLPSYREGFGSVIIEAAACGVPAIGSDIYGISDAIRGGETGLLFPAGDITALREAIAQMVQDSEVRKRMGQAALQRAQKEFSTKRLVQAWLEYYDGLQ